jgi:hypothetical protein
MKTKNQILALVLALSLLLVGTVLANGSATLSWQVLSGGASDSTAEGVALHATLGQPVVGAVSSTDGSITVGQGMWPGGAATTQYKNYLPLVLRRSA